MLRCYGAPSSPVTSALNSLPRVWLKPALPQESKDGFKLNNPVQRLFPPPDNSLYVWFRINKVLKAGGFPLHRCLRTAARRETPHPPHSRGKDRGRDPFFQGYTQKAMSWVLFLRTETTETQMPYKLHLCLTNVRLHLCWQNVQILFSSTAVFTDIFPQIWANSVTSKNKWVSAVE